MKGFSARVGKHGRLLWVPGDHEGKAVITSDQFFATQLIAKHFRGGKQIDERLLGSGSVSNIGVDMMANDTNFMTAATPFSTLASMNYHACGTGTNASAATDYYLQTVVPSADLTGSTNGYMTGTVTPPTNAAPNVYQTAATFNFNTTLAITEWGIAMSNAAPFTGTATSTSATSLTNTGASFTNTGNKLAGWAIEANASPINTPTTTVWGLVGVNAGNSGTVLELAAGWLTLANAAASTPGGTTAYVVYPGMFDHHQFAALNVVNLDAIQFIYKLTINSGG